MTDEKTNPFRNSDVIEAYSRKQAIEDGVLIDVSDIAREAGFRYPVAVTRALWEDIASIPHGKEYQDREGRLWDVLWMGLVAIRNNKRTASFLFYDLILDRGHRKSYTVKMVCGPGDTAEPVITLMRPSED